MLMLRMFLLFSHCVCAVLRNDRVFRSYLYKVQNLIFSNQLCRSLLSACGYVRPQWLYSNKSITVLYEHVLH